MLRNCAPIATSSPRHGRRCYNALAGVCEANSNVKNRHGSRFL